MYLNMNMIDGPQGYIHRYLGTNKDQKVENKSKDIHYYGKIASKNTQKTDYTGYKDWSSWLQGDKNQIKIKDIKTVVLNRNLKEVVVAIIDE